MKTKNKKNYVPPQMAIITVQPCEMLATSNILNTHNWQGDEEDFTRGRRGRWGNLWDESKQ